MINIDTFKLPIIDVLKNGFLSASAYAIRAIKVVQSVPYQMQNNSHTAVVVLSIANGIIFNLSNLLANYLDERVAKCRKKHDCRERRFNQILINGLVFGGTCLIFNIVVSKLLHYPLSKLTFIAIVAVLIGVRILLNCGCSSANQE
jgi:hypothetical protein